MLGRAFRVVRDPGWGRWATGDDLVVGGNTNAGQRVDGQNSLGLLTFYGCVQFITQTVSTLPVDTFREVKGTPVAMPKPGWLQQPSKYVDSIAFASQALTSLLLDGNIFVVPIRNEYERVIEAYILDPTKVQFDRSQGTPRVLVDGRYYGGELIHVPWVVLPGEIRGVNPVAAARETIGMGMAAVEADARMFGQGMITPGVISFPGVPTEQQLTDIRDGWSRHYGGAKNAHKPGMLFGGATFQGIQMSAKDAQFIESRQFTAIEIISLLFNLPADLFGMNQAGSSLTYQNVVSRWSEVLRRLMPWIVRLEQLYSQMLPTPQYVKLNASSYLRADTKTRYETHAIGINAKFLLPNEARDIEDLPPIPGGDTFASEPVDMPIDEPADTVPMPTPIMNGAWPNSNSQNGQETLRKGRHK